MDPFSLILGLGLGGMTGLLAGLLWMKGKIAEKEKRVLVLEERLNLKEEEFSFLKGARRELEEVFERLSLRALEEVRRGFLSLAEEKLAAKEETWNLQFSTLSETLKRLQEQIQELERSRQGAYGRLEKQIETLVFEHLPRLEAEARRLSEALREPQTRGRWGEIQLRRVVEVAGLLPHCDFVEQATLDNGHRPDLLLKLPGGRVLAIDAKAPMAAYFQEREGGGARDYLLALKGHIRRLGTKEYWAEIAKLSQGSPEFVVLFLPAEPLLTEALRADPEIFEFAARNRVILATPMSLLALLKTVAFLLREERVIKNAKEVASLGRELHRRLRTFTEHLLRLGQRLEKTVEEYNQVSRTLETRVIPWARRFEDLGAQGGKALPSLRPLEKGPRSPKA